MQKEPKDNTNFETNIGPPMPQTPHFDLKRIEAAKPVEPLSNTGWQPKVRGAAQRQFRRRLGLLAIVAVAVLIMTAAAAAFIGFRPAPQAASDTSASKENTSAESAPTAAPVSIERPPTEKPPTSLSRAEPRHRTSRRMVRAWEVTNVTPAPSKGKSKPRLVDVIH